LWQTDHARYAGISIKPQSIYRMKIHTSTVLIGSGLALAAAVAYDASILATSLGVSHQGGEGTVALLFLSASIALLALGIRGRLIQRRQRAWPAKS
jgi:hypothetical protein